MTARPRILHVYKDYYPPVLGGIETTINLMAHGTRDEFDVTVLVNSGSRERVEETLDGIRVVRVPELRRFASAPLSPAFIPALRREAARADLLHFHHPNPTGDVACMISAPAKPLVITYHSDVVRQQKLMWIYGPVQELMMRRARVIMPTSPNYIESSPWLQRHREKCQVVPLGIDLSRFEKTPEVEKRSSEIRACFPKPISIFVGRLRYYKGLEFLVRAAPQIPGSIFIGGTGPDGERLRQIAAEEGVSDRVHFLGDLSESELIASLYAADVFCMPSHLRSEAFGLSQIEAMACGLPVVSCRIDTGVPFVNLDGESGVSVAPADPQALAQAIGSLYDNDELRSRLAAGALHRAHEHFSAERMCNQVAAVYRQVLAQQ